MLAKYAVYYATTKFLYWFYFWVGRCLIGWFVLFVWDFEKKRIPDKRIWPGHIKLKIKTQISHNGWSALNSGLLHGSSSVGKVGFNTTHDEQKKTHDSCEFP